ncbi:DUF2863 family protein [Methyloversatilis thermotolerans]|uniref:DUF2863 family protein n=1 Tax=Methyloversatilis thermotolerans TaxID=1346290 RepID=UPI00035E5F37|nr:DUF2863 family protein [Methyloversatilis thermotolerans]
MKRTRFARRGGLTQDAALLTRLANGLAESASRVEDRYWELRLTEQVSRLVGERNEDALNAALDHLWRENGPAYDALADFIEGGVECGLPGDAGKEWDAVMFAAPLLAWSRFSIPAGPIPAPILASLKVQLCAHAFGARAKVALADYLFSPDQLPRGYVETRDLADDLGEAVLAGDDLKLEAESMAQTTTFLSDTRYVIGMVMVPRGQPMFRWQEDDGARDHVIKQWQAQGGAVMSTLLRACAFDLLPPNAYHSACREADRASRAYSLRASVAFLEQMLAVPPSGLRAIIAPFHDKQLEEYRIAFTTTNSSQVVHGVVWALLGAEDEESDIVGEIEGVLRECGVTDTLVLDHRMPMEYCDDCGAPLYPDPDGQPVHAEMPEAGEQPPMHLH